MEARSPQMAAFADTLAARIERGESLTFESFMADKHDSITKSDFQEALLLAEHRAAQSWGLVPIERRLSRDTFDNLPVEAQARFITEGGKVYDQQQQQSEADKMKEPITFNGKTITRGDWEGFTPQQQAQFVKGTLG